MRRAIIDRWVRSANSNAFGKHYAMKSSMSSIVLIIAGILTVILGFFFWPNAAQAVAYSPPIDINGRIIESDSHPDSASHLISLSLIITGITLLTFGVVNRCRNRDS